MRCPKCGATKSSVIDSRQAEEGNTIRRRRECEECQHRFTTYERVEERTLVVVKKDGTREQFSLTGLFAQPRNVQCPVMKLAWWSIASNKNSVVAMKMKFRVRLLVPWLWKSWQS